MFNQKPKFARIKKNKIIFIDGRASAWPPDFCKGRPELRKMFENLILDVVSIPRLRGRMELSAVFGDFEGNVTRRTVMAWHSDLSFDDC